MGRSQNSKKYPLNPRLGTATISKVIRADLVNRSVTTGGSNRSRGGRKNARGAWNINSGSDRNMQLGEGMVKSNRRWIIALSIVVGGRG